METLQQVQLKAAHLFFGVGTHHPGVSLLWELGDLPVVWLAKLRCVVFWFKVLTSPMYDMRLLEGDNRVSMTWQGLVGEEDGQVLPGFQLGECGATTDPESVRDRTKRDAGECSMEKGKGEMERRTGEETEVVNYADHHHGMWGRVEMCWDKDEE